MKTLGAVIILSAAVAAPAFARDAGVLAPHHAHAQSNFRGAYNQSNEPFYAVPATQAGRNMENFGFSGRDPSRVGGEDPSLNPPS